MQSMSFAFVCKHMPSCTGISLRVCFLEILDVLWGWTVCVFVCMYSGHPPSGSRGPAESRLFQGGWEEYLSLVLLYAFINLTAFFSNSVFLSAHCFSFLPLAIFTIYSSMFDWQVLARNSL